ncbi:MAG: L-Ala-D/L-Glu epimerase [Sphingomonadales bacterium]|nr:L-Ala-D/L-Glu epimerase [Sphingomonadales bacterium]
MQVAEIELVPYALPFAKPYSTARGTLERREMALVRLVTDDGPVGLGEAVLLALRGGESLAEVERAIGKVARRLRRAVLTDFAGPEPMRAVVDVFIHAVAGRRLPAPAKAALEMALLDLAGKASQRPVWELLGAASAAPVRCNATLVAGEPGAVAADAADWAGRGFSTFKLKLGTGDDVAQVRAVREAVGPEARIRVDANGAWSVDEALGVLRMIEPLDIELAEQPVAGLRELAAVAEATPIPIAADESVATAKEAKRAAAARACDLATVKLAKVGGVGEASGIAGQLPVYLSSALDGPLGIAAAAHAAQALAFEGAAAGLAHGLATQLLFSDTVASRECALEQDRLSPPDGHGLGVEIDEQALERLRI